MEYTGKVILVIAGVNGAYRTNLQNLWIIIAGTHTLKELYITVILIVAHSLRKR
jgi:hypothetical protein